MVCASGMKGPAEVSANGGAASWSRFMDKSTSADNGVEFWKMTDGQYERESKHHAQITRQSIFVAEVSVNGGGAF